MLAVDRLPITSAFVNSKGIETSKGASALPRLAVGDFTLPARLYGLNRHRINILKVQWLSTNTTLADYIPSLKGRGFVSKIDKR